MERCPSCKNRGGLKYGCLEDECDIYLSSDDLELEECGGACWCCVDCGTINIGEEVFSDEYSDIQDAYDVDDYVLTDNIDWSGE